MFTTCQPILISEFKKKMCMLSFWRAANQFFILVKLCVNQKEFYWVFCQFLYQSKPSNHIFTYRGNIARFRICCCLHVMNKIFFDKKSKKNLGKHGVSNPKGKKRGDIGQDSIQLNQFFHRVWLTNKTHRSSVGGKMSVGFHNIDFLCGVIGT